MVRNHAVLSCVHGFTCCACMHACARGAKSGRIREFYSQKENLVDRKFSESLRVKNSSMYSWFSTYFIRSIRCKWKSKLFFVSNSFWHTPVRFFLWRNEYKYMKATVCLFSTNSSAKEIKKLFASRKNLFGSACSSSRKYFLFRLVLKNVAAERIFS